MGYILAAFSLHKLFSPTFPKAAFDWKISFPYKAPTLLRPTGFIPDQMLNFFQSSMANFITFNDIHNASVPLVFLGAACGL